MILPLHLNMLIRPATTSVSPGGILLTESTSGFQRGTIVEMGDGEFQNGTFIDSAYDTGIVATEDDDVYFTGGAPITDPGTGETFVLVHYNNIVAIIRPDEDDEVPSFGGYTDWIPWSGGDCPVDYDVEVMIALRYEVADGEVELATSNAGSWGWSHLGNDDDIVFYRLV